jgi:glutaredoxin 3
MFAKSYCPYCNKAKDLLKSLKVPFENVDLDLVDNGAEIQNDLAQLSGQRTVPNIFIKGKHIGGCDKLHALHADGKLLPLLNSDEKSEL